MQVADGREREGADDAVRGQAHIALELAHGILGICAENPVLAPARKTERAKRVLEFDHVVAVEVGHTQVERTVAHVIRRVDQRRPCVLVDFVALFENLIGFLIERVGN